MREAGHVVYAIMDELSGLQEWVQKMLWIDFVRC